MNIIDFGSGDPETTRKNWLDHYHSQLEFPDVVRKHFGSDGPITVYCVDPKLPEESQTHTKGDVTVHTFSHVSRLVCEQVDLIMVINPNPGVFFCLNSKGAAMDEEQFHEMQFPNALAHVIDEHLAPGGKLYWQQDDEYTNQDRDGEVLGFLHDYTELGPPEPAESHFSSTFSYGWGDSFVMVKAE